MGLSFLGMPVEINPTITQYSFEDLGDAPHLHRWRAFWGLGDFRDEVSGIELKAYRVTRLTPTGAWIDTDNFRTGGVWETDDWHKKRWVSNDGGQAWAKPTRDAAIHSIAVRLTRWTNNLAREIDRARSAADALEKLRPDLESYALTARSNLPIPKETSND